MTVEEAYRIVLANHPGQGCLGCCDYGELYGFYIPPVGFDPEKDIGYGGGIVTINKSTGEIGNYNPVADNFQLYDKAKQLTLPGSI